MVESLLDTAATWLSGRGADSDIVVNSQCRLVRNIAGFPFPSQCHDDDRRAIEKQVKAALQSLNLMSSGKYWSIERMDPVEARVLAERRLITPGLVASRGPRGAYISDDQSMSIAVNDSDHITFVALSSGQQLQETWARVNLVDDMLSGLVDYAFNERLGFLTSSVGDLGTGLKMEAVVHLPALAMSGHMGSIRTMVMDNRHSIEPLFGSQDEAPGDLYRVANVSTLGRSEEEIVFHVKHQVTDIVQKERSAREEISAKAPMQLEDRIWRAVGMARRARLLTFQEALEVLSALRIGVSQHQLDQYTVGLVNEVLLTSQNGHLEMRHGHECDELTLNTERAELFRARFV